MMCGGMMLLLIPGAISNSNAVIRQEFRKLRFQMIDDSVSNLSENLMHAAVGSFKHFLVCLPLSFSRHQPFESCEQLATRIGLETYLSIPARRPKLRKHGGIRWHRRA